MNFHSKEKLYFRIERKAFVILSATLLVLIFTIKSSSARGFINIEGGYGGPTSAVNFTFGGGWSGLGGNSVSRLLLGGGLTFILNGGETWERNPSYSWSSEFGGFAIIGVRPVWRFLLLTTLGFTAQEVRVPTG
jgi:hypothetical protein